MGLGRLLDHHLPAADASSAGAPGERSAGSATNSRPCAAPTISPPCCMGSERQLLVSWSGRDGEPRFQGDPTIVGENAPA